METFLEQLFVSGIGFYVMAGVCLLGMISKYLVSIRYSGLIRQSENGALIKDKYLRQWKSKFENTYRLSHGVNNISLYIKKQMSHYRIFAVPMFKADRINLLLAGFLLLAGAVLSYICYRTGRGAERALTFAAVSAALTAVMVYWEFFCGTWRKRDRLMLNLQDYYENTLALRLEHGVETITAENKVEQPGQKDPERLKRDVEYLKQSLDRIAAGAEKNGGETRMPAFGEKEERLIDEIIKEYLY